MEQLSGLDATFLYLESATQPMHIGSLAIYDPSSAPGGKATFKQILKHTLDRSAIGSYCGQWSIGASCCRDMMSDPAFYAACLQRSFEELFSACSVSAAADGVIA